jgi:flagellar protein FlaG
MAARVVQLPPVAPPLEPNHNRLPPQQAPTAAGGRDEEIPANQRLVIDEDPGSGVFVYKTVDRMTGEVLLQLPRDELLRLRRDVAYQAGAVIKTRA